MLTFQIGNRFFVNFKLDVATVLREVVVIVSFFFPSLRIKMSLQDQDGVAENAALL